MTFRVCYVLSQFHPIASGAERQALAQGRELVRRGHVVHVLTRSFAGLARDEVVDGVQVHRWIRTSTLGPLFGLSFVAGVIRGLRRLRPYYDVIHTHQALWESIATGLGRDLFRDAPVLVQPASSGYFGEAQEMARTKGFPVLRRLALRNRRFAAISAEIEAEWRALGVPPDRILRTASGVDAEHFRPGPSLLENRLPPPPRVIFTGRLHPQKNLDLLLDIWGNVARSTQASLVLVGDGPDRGRLETRVQALHLETMVHFAGAVADPAEYLRASDVFVLPSVAEGMSNSLLEAMSTALPCLASNIGGNCDLIDSGRTGLLIDTDDPSAWTREIVHVVTDRAFARALGQQARERIDREFALRRVVDRYLALYAEMLGRPALALQSP